MVGTKILQRGHAAKGLMRAEAVVEVLPSTERGVERLEMAVSVVEVVERLGVGAMGAFHTAVELG